jgi:DeoR family glycerol-3-phosphate regulon repressor
MKPERRRDRIVEVVRERERITVEALAEMFGASRETIRRDLGALAEAGRIRKVHGGGARLDGPREGPFAERLGQAVLQKRAVAAAAAALFNAGDTILLDVGTTTLMFAEALGGRADLTIITNGLEIARVLADRGARVFVVGGEYRPETGEMVGVLAVEQIGRFYAAHAVITVGALSVRGAMDFQLEEAEVARAMIAQARLVTVIADSSKLDREALFQVCPLEAVGRLVVDQAPAGGLARALAAAGVEIIVAGPQK